MLLHDRDQVHKTLTGQLGAHVPSKPSGKALLVKAYGKEVEDLLEADDPSGAAAAPIGKNTHAVDRIWRADSSPAVEGLLESAVDAGALCLALASLSCQCHTLKCVQVRQSRATRAGEGATHRSPRRARCVFGRGACSHQLVDGVQVHLSIVYRRGHWHFIVVVRIGFLGFLGPRRRLGRGAPPLPLHLAHHALEPDRCVCPTEFTVGHDRVPERREPYDAAEANQATDTDRRQQLHRRHAWPLPRMRAVAALALAATRTILAQNALWLYR